LLKIETKPPAGWRATQLDNYTECFGSSKGYMKIFSYFLTLFSPDELHPGKPAFTGPADVPHAG
jgi:hypothetical protein